MLPVLPRLPSLLVVPPMLSYGGILSISSHTVESCLAASRPDRNFTSTIMDHSCSTTAFRPVYELHYEYVSARTRHVVLVIVVAFQDLDN